MPRVRWKDWTTDRVLDLRFAELKIGIKGSWLEPLVERIRKEMKARGFRFKPHFWLADEWFSPVGVPGVAVPFYLAHKRLMQIERTLMYEIEGGTRTECLKLLRHEVGHAVDTAYGLTRRKRYRELFGSASTPYPDFYRPRPGSKRYVQHLPGWYAQSHPCEDFAETFAVWLAPRSGWRTKYVGWAARKKLEYVDEVMTGLVSEPPRVRCREKPYSLPKLRHTLRDHYENKRAHYDVGYSEAYDRDLLDVFMTVDPKSKKPKAAPMLRRRRRRIREIVAKRTGSYEFTVDLVLREMIGRCRELDLRLVGSEDDATNEFAIMLAVHTVHQMHRGAEWHPV
jgi:hypothetical protein